MLDDPICVGCGRIDCNCNCDGDVEACICLEPPTRRNPGGVSRGYASALNWGGPLFRNNPSCCDECAENGGCCGGSKKYMRRNPGGVSRGYASALNWGGPLFRRNPGGVSRGYASALNWGGPLFRKNPGGVSRGYASALNWGGPLFRRRNPGGVSRGYASALNWGGPLFRNPTCNHCRGTGLVFDGVCPMCHGNGARRNPGGISRGYASTLNWGGPLFRNNPDLDECAICSEFLEVCPECSEKEWCDSCGTCSACEHVAARNHNPGGVSRGYASALNWGGPLFRNPGSSKLGFSCDKCNKKSMARCNLCRAQSWCPSCEYCSNCEATEMGRRPMWQPPIKNPGGVSRGYASALNWGGPLFKRSYR